MQCIRIRIYEYESSILFIFLNIYCWSLVQHNCDTDKKPYLLQHGMTLIFLIAKKVACCKCISNSLKSLNTYDAVTFSCKCLTYFLPATLYGLPGCLMDWLSVCLSMRLLPSLSLCICHIQTICVGYLLRLAFLSKYFTVLMSCKCHAL